MAVEGESDYTFMEGRPMATTDTTTTPAAMNQPEQVPDPSVETVDPSAPHYERLRARLKGTVTILGDIVRSDPDLWV
jgi:hypothetical protein